ncbi:hypothetical protein CC80DRAFT_546800 [Byssothecium circinans]|uniref:F-box domain-containing protein n=1 Tax=Byssothecium circinans TaxID=147558 RepID=A0A6A5TYM2_9PLEO|nr:hypothetical protein CC80DRAFT_546800 [Byssothecium circinans]
MSHHRSKKRALEYLIEGPRLVQPAPKDRLREWVKDKDGELVPVYQMYAPTQLDPFKRLPVLYRERKRMIKRTAPALPSFLTLPLEIRRRIYQYVVVQGLVIRPLGPSIPGPKFRSVSATSRSLLRTCKLVNAETRAMFYGDNVFRFDQVQY